MCTDGNTYIYIMYIYITKKYIYVVIYIYITVIYCSCHISRFMWVNGDRGVRSSTPKQITHMMGSMLLHSLGSLF